MGDTNRSSLVTARTHQAIRVGLRRLLRDKNVDPKALMKAIELLMKVEGLLDEKGRVVSPKNKHAINRMSDATDMELQRLYDLAQEKKRTRVVWRAQECFGDIATRFAQGCSPAVHLDLRFFVFLERRLRNSGSTQTVFRRLVPSSSFTPGAKVIGGMPTTSTLSPTLNLPLAMSG
jgi:hypothetical protein